MSKAREVTSENLFAPALVRASIGGFRLPLAEPLWPTHLLASEQVHSLLLFLREALENRQPLLLVLRSRLFPLLALLLLLHLKSAYSLRKPMESLPLLEGGAVT